MSPKIKVVAAPRPTLHLPAHEHAARRQRARTAALPGIPGTRPTRQPQPPVHAGRRTFDTRILSTNFERNPN